MPKMEKREVKSVNEEPYAIKSSAYRKIIVIVQY